MSSTTKGIAGILAVGIAGAGLVIWFFYFQAPASPPTDTPDGSFGVGPARTSTAVVPSETNGTLPAAGGTQSARRIFKISDGPVAGATLIDTTRPTSTIARFTLAANGHTFDLLLDSKGAIPKALSNTTIPGIAEVVWTDKGRGALLRYLDRDTFKTAHLSLPPAGATTSSAARLQFLPADITRIAVSPDGASAAYLIRTQTGVDGYLSRADGANAKKLFSLPLSQVELSWPSATTLLIQSASAAGVGGVVFSVDTSSGAVTPLLYARGLTATANRDFSRLVYQTADSDRRTYSQNVKTGLSIPLSFTPVPELCVWSMATSSALYCAAPVTYLAPNYLDLFHLGVAQANMSILSYDLAAGQSSIVAVPGGSDGGSATEISEIAVSSSDRYLLFITKGERSLWGVRLSE